MAVQADLKKWVRAIQTGNFNSILELLNFGVVDINLIDGDGMTALHHAVRSKHYGITKFLLSENIDCAIKDRFGQTALEVAKDIGQIKLVNLIRVQWIKQILAQNKTKHLTFFFNGAVDKLARLTYLKLRMQGYDVQSIPAEDCYVKERVKGSSNIFLFNGITQIESVYLGIGSPRWTLCVFDEVVEYLKTIPQNNCKINLNYIKKMFGLEDLPDDLIASVLTIQGTNYFVDKTQPISENLCGVQHQQLKIGALQDVVDVKPITKKQLFARITKSEQNFLKQFVEVCKKWGAEKVVVTGSVVDFNKNSYSDIDIILEIEPILLGYVFNELGCEVEEVVSKERVESGEEDPDNLSNKNSLELFYMQQLVQERVKIVKLINSKHYKIPVHGIDIVVPKKFQRKNGQVVLWEKK